MKNDDFKITDETSKLLRKILIACLEKNIDLSIYQEGEKNDTKFYKDGPKYLMITISDTEDKNLPSLLKEWLHKIKTIPL